MGRFLVVVPLHVDVGFREAVFLVHGVPFVVGVVDLGLRLRDLASPRGDLLVPLAELVFESLLPIGADLPESVLDLPLGELDFALAELDLIPLPLAIVVCPHHQGKREKQADRREGEDDVQPVRTFGHLGVAAGLGLHRGHFSSPRRPRAGEAHMLKKISGMATMYFRLKSQRRTILMGSAIWRRRSMTKTAYRHGPSFATYFLSHVFARIPGSTTT